MTIDLKRLVYFYNKRKEKQIQTKIVNQKTNHLKVIFAILISYPLIIANQKQ